MEITGETLDVILDSLAEQLGRSASRRKWS